MVIATQGRSCLVTHCQLALDLKVIIKVAGGMFELKFQGG